MTCKLSCPVGRIELLTLAPQPVMLTQGFQSMLLFGKHTSKRVFWCFCFEASIFDDIYTSFYWFRPKIEGWWTPRAKRELLVSKMFWILQKWAVWKDLSFNMAQKFSQLRCSLKRKSKTTQLKSVDSSLVIVFWLFKVKPLILKGQYLGQWSS